MPAFGSDGPWLLMMPRILARLPVPPVMTPDVMFVSFPSPLLFQLRPVDDGGIVPIGPPNFEEPSLMSWNIANVDYMLLGVCRLSCRGIIADMVLLLGHGHRSGQSHSDSNSDSKRI